MTPISAILGADAFRALKEGKTSSSVNRALFDAVTLAYSFSEADSLVGLEDALRAAHSSLISSRDFVDLINGATADRSRVHARVTTYANAMQAAGAQVTLPAGLETGS